MKGSPTIRLNDAKPPKIGEVNDGQRVKDDSDVFDVEDEGIGDLYVIAPDVTKSELTTKLNERANPRSEQAQESKRSKTVDVGASSRREKRSARRSVLKMQFEARQA